MQDLPHIYEIARIRLCDLQARIYSKSYDLRNLILATWLCSHKPTTAP